ncbi:MAG: hypothetical protein AB7H66_17870 [Hyphomonadaceae bacterium]
MSTARPAPAFDADFVEIGEQRRTDRRASDRRAQRLKLVPMFAATLVNQIAKPEDAKFHGYTTAWRGPRAGVMLNVRA